MKKAPAKHVLAIDQGTTGTTALLLDASGGVRGRGYAELPQHFPRPGWVEHDPEEIWRSVGAAVRRALGRSIPDAIGITNQRETTILWDRRTSKPIAHAIVWQCRRTTAMCQTLRENGWEPLVRKRTGLLLDPYFSGTKVAWLLRHVRGAARRAARGELAFGTVDTWLVWRLTGGRSHVTDYTNASRTLLFDIGKRRWDTDLLDLFGVPASLLPEVHDSSGPFGETRGVPGLPDGIPILGVAGDQQAALYGQGCFHAGEAKNTYGTGCFLLLQTGDRRPSSKHGLLITLACDAAGRPSYALEGAVFIAGAVVQWLRDGMKLIQHAADVEALARSVPNTLDTVFVPAFVGLGAPYWRPEARGAWLGLTRGVTSAHLARAALESIAYQTCDVADAMVADSGRRLSSLRVDGGAAANDFLLQFQADVLGIPIQRPRMLETTALGAAALAARAAGVWPSGRPPGAMGATERVFRPRVSRTRREEMIAGWRAAVARLLA
jgi:glycerol kinase